MRNYTKKLGQNTSNTIQKELYSHALVDFAKEQILLIEEEVYTGSDPAYF